MLDSATTLGGQEVWFQVQDGGPRENATGDSWGDAVPGPTVRFVAATAQQVRVAKGTVLRWLPAASMSLTFGRAWVYALEPDDSIDDAEEPGAGLDLGGDNAGLDVPVPLEAGRWLLSLYVWFQTDCVSGDGYVDLLLLTE